jgi:hypothetical protein
MFILLLQYDESKISQLIKIVSKVINVFSFQFMFCVQNRGKKEKWLLFFKFGAERGETEKKMQDGDKTLLSIELILENNASSHYDFHFLFHGLMQTHGSSSVDQINSIYLFL